MLQNQIFCSSKLLWICQKIEKSWNFVSQKILTLKSSAMQINWPVFVWYNNFVQGILEQTINFFCRTIELLWSSKAHVWFSFSEFSCIIKFLRIDNHCSSFPKIPENQFFHLWNYLVIAENATMRRILRRCKFLKKEFYRQFFF